jgi:uncharacterized protein with FMN-binding domain
MKKILIIAAIMAGLLCLTAIGQPSTAYKDGVYSLDYMDAELGNLSLQVTVKDGRLAAVTFPLGTGDLQMDPATLESWLRTFIAAPDFMKVDAVSGATDSCNLLRYAVQNALKQAVNK